LAGSPASTGSFSCQFFQSWLAISIAMHLVRLDLHPAASPIPLLAPPKLAIHKVEIHRQSSRQSRNERNQSLAVRLSGSFKT
jgi:hypothetical protein